VLRQSVRFGAALGLVFGIIYFISSCVVGQEAAARRYGHVKITIMALSDYVEEYRDWPASWKDLYSSKGRRMRNLDEVDWHLVQGDVRLEFDADLNMFTDVGQLKKAISPTGRCFDFTDDLEDLERAIRATSKPNR
jgi:hypothetical protein